MAKGRIRFFNTTRGYGFIIPDTGGDDVFLHISDLSLSGPVSLWPGMRIEYTPVPKGAGGFKATAVKFAGNTYRIADELLKRAEQLANGGKDDVLDADLMRRAAATLTASTRQHEAVS